MEFGQAHFGLVGLFRLLHKARRCEALPEPAVQQLHALAERGIELVLSVGTSSLFPYISQPVMLAKQFGIPTVEINPGSTCVSEHVDCRIEAPCEKALVAIWDAMQSLAG